MSIPEVTLLVLDVRENKHSMNTLISIICSSVLRVYFGLIGAKNVTDLRVHVAAVTVHSNKSVNS